MKIKAILFVLALTAASAFGQGSVSFQNSVAAGTTIFTSSGVQMAPGGNTFSFYFTYGTTSGNLNQTSTTFFNHASSSGRIAGDTDYELNAGFPALTPAFFQLYAFQTSAGSFAAAQAGGGLWYQSSVITASPADPLNPAGTPLFGSGAGTQFQGFTMVPEPSTYALGALGLGALAFIRRRK